MVNYMTHTSDKSKNTALILCGIGGFMGLHQFYVGKISKGFLYMCTAGLLGVGWFGDLISISLGNFRDNSGAPLRG
ncbi:MAG: TM2 domain-containing protein [Candidatus Pacearchaeota archaeon]|nr:TM2 domain-containing protein [Candidatus Pacearchaeota archaeon]